MRYWLLRPDALLRQQIRCYFVVDAGRSPYPSTELLLPDGYAEIVFALDAGFERWGVGEERHRTVMRRSYVIGGRSRSVLTGGSARLRLVGVKLDPRFLRQIIGMPLSEFRDATLDLDDLSGRSLLSLEDAVAGAGSIPEIASRLNRFFLRELRDAQSNDDLVDYFLARIHGQHGTGPITQWARERGIDTRTLERRFCASIGMTPKKYARIVRFKHSYHRLIAASGRSGSSQGDHLEGYYDQSHFNKDFRFFTGVAPSTLMAARMTSSTAVTDHLLRGDLSPASL